MQLFSHIALRIVSVFYLGNRVECPICDHKFRKFLPFGRKSRGNALCPNCLALERHRLIWFYLKEKTDFFQSNIKLLHVGPEICFINRFEQLPHLDYVTADIDSPLAKVKMDIENIPLDDNSIDVVLCSHVLEHVNNDKKAMSELFRVLKLGGWAILQVPVFHPIPETTFEDLSITDPKERERLFGQDDHVRLYGKDYPDRLRSVGFEVKVEDYAKEIGMEAVRRFALPIDDPIYFCKKTSVDVQQ